MEELGRQPFSWNSLFTLPSGQMMATRSRLAWGKKDTGPAATYNEWLNFNILPLHSKQQLLQGLGGGELLMQQLDQGRWNTHPVGQSQQTVKWIGAFTGFSVLIGVKAYLQQGNFMAFDVLQKGKAS